jgi:hypothetical protein
MTYREDFTLPAELLEQVKEQGLEVLPELIRVILNIPLGEGLLTPPGRDRRSRPIIMCAVYSV